MKKILIVGSLLSVLAGAAFAGGPVVLSAEAPVSVVSETWTGAYAGLSAGQVSLGGVSENTAGVFAGYRYDFGRMVAGGEVDYRTATDSGASGDATLLKANVGIDAGKVLPYATVGFGDLGIGNETVYGVGVDMKVGKSYQIGAEYLRSEKSELDLFALKAAYRF